jgi:protein disulfide-isomerase-like protein
VLCFLVVCLSATLSVAEKQDPSGLIIALDAGNFDDNIKPNAGGGGKLWLVEFYAPWCHHCQAFAPIYDKIAAQISSTISVGKVDCPANNDLCTRFGIQSYPTLYLIDESTARVYRYGNSKTEAAVLDFVRSGAWKKASFNDYPFPNSDAMAAYFDEGAVARVSHFITNYPFRAAILFFATFVGVSAGYLAFVAGDHGKPEENKLTL